MGEWISVKERLPDREQCRVGVAVAIDGYVQRNLAAPFRHVSGKHSWYSLSGAGVGTGLPFTPHHWMPLPEPPKPVTKDEALRLAIGLLEKTMLFGEYGAVTAEALPKLREALNGQ
jgi:hypothetical protein